MTFVKKLSNNRSALIGIIILIPLVFGSMFGPMLAPHSPTETNADNRYASPSVEHPMGTDNYGRDIISRVLLGGQTSLVMGLVASTLALTLGVPIGLAAGYSGGKIDEAIMRLMDVMMSFPTLILALLILTALSASMWNAILAVGLVYAPRIARIVRASTLSVKNEEFVKAAKVRGESSTYIMYREILPNISGPIIVEGSIRVGYAILVATSLSFLGLGAQPPTPDWGYMVAEARNHIYHTPWFLLAPSVALSLTVIGFNLLGDGLRDVVEDN
ncbi:ABC transporter permease [Natronorubrum tibetense]